MLITPSGSSQPSRYVCTKCGWEELAHPIYGWQRHNAHAVHVHKTQLCPKRDQSELKSFYSVVTVYDDFTKVIDYPNIDLAQKEYDFRYQLSLVSDAIFSVRLLRVSPNRILDITPEQG